MAATITASATSGNRIKFDDTAKPDFVPTAVQSTGRAQASGDNVIVYDNGNPVLSADYSSFATPSGASAKAVADLLNASPYFLTSGGSLPSNVVIVTSESDFVDATTHWEMTAGTAYWIGSNIAMNRDLKPQLDSIAYGNDRDTCGLLFDGTNQLVLEKGCKFRELLLNNNASTALFSGTITSGDLLIENCDLTGNTDIGAIVNSTGEVDIINCQIESNGTGLSVTASAKDANIIGGSYASNTGNLTVVATVQDAVVSGCDVKNNTGGVTVTATAADAALIDCQYSTNTAGATVTAAGVAEVRNCTFAGSASPLSPSGAIVLLKESYFGSTNTGTFVTLSGTPLQVDMQECTLLPPAGATGLDHSACTPSAAATFIGNTVVSLGGTTITGTFASPWVVRSNIGATDFPVTDQSAEGEVLWSSALVTSTPTQNAWVKVAGTTQTKALFDFDDDGGTNNRLRYIGTDPIKRTVSASISVTSAVNNKTYEWTFVKNGTVTATDALSASRRKIANGADVGCLPVTNSFDLVTNDYIELFVRCIDVTTSNMTMELGNYEVS